MLSLAKTAIMMLGALITIGMIQTTDAFQQLFKTTTTTTTTSNYISAPHYYVVGPTSSTNYRTGSTRLFMATFNTDSDDPFVVLGLDPTSDKKEIKRAYKRLALKFHPDMATNKDSTEQEKKMASDRFAKINWAYELLSGKGSTSSTSSSSSRTSSSTSSGGWTPPHRRKSGYSGSRTTTTSDDWRDYIPNYNKVQDDEYDTGGDSFGAIFADLMKGAAAGAASYSTGGSPGIFRDFVEFLENNVDGYASSGASGSNGDDSQLRILLTTGTIEEIGEEMDDSDLIIQQLSSKTMKLLEEIAVMQAQSKEPGIRYSAKMDMEIQIDELQARKRVYDGYIQKAKKRLLALQTRYKELIVNGGNDSKAGGRSSSSSSSSSSWNNDYNTRSSTSSRTSYESNQQQSPNTSSSSTKKDSEESWKSEGFGSYGRGRGSSRRGSASSRRRRRTTTAEERTTTTSSSSSTASSSSNNDSYSSSRAGSSSSYQRETTTSSSSSSYNNRPSGSSRSSSSSSSSSEGYVPPHRRGTSYESREDQDRRRLRELQVDDEFEKLKKELGL